MGFRMRKSFKVAPGVRMTVSRSGVGYSVGGKAMRVTKTARGQVRTTTRMPGTGISHTSTLPSGRRGAGPASGAVPPQLVKPGLFAPKAEKELYAALFRDENYARLQQIAERYPDWAPVCATFDGLFAYQRGDLMAAEQALRASLGAGGDIGQHPFIRKYASASIITLKIADGVEAAMPLGRGAVGLTLAELYQATGRLGEAVAVVEQLEPTFTAAISLAELYSEQGRHTEVIGMTNGLANESDAHAFLLVLRARALREREMYDAARESLKEALRRRSVDAQIKNRAYFERANVCLLQRRRAQARKDLERIIADDADYPGARELLAELGTGK